MVLIAAYTLLFIGGYVTSSYTWPWLRTKLGGVELEIKDLETRIAHLILPTVAEINAAPVAAPVIVAPPPPPAA